MVYIVFNAGSSTRPNSKESLNVQIQCHISCTNRIGPNSDQLRAEPQSSAASPPPRAWLCVLALINS